MKINTMMSRHVVLDTETTGMNKFGIHYEGHRIIEIGAVEIINRRLTNKKFHVYLNPERSIDPEAFRIHGISDQFLINKPFFSDIADKFLTFVRGSNLVIHNASFDVGFLNFELKNIDEKFKTIESYCDIIDSLKIARKIFPGQRNSLDALCERYTINSNRVLHNALYDAQILAYVFLSMTREQTKMDFMNTSNINDNICAQQTIMNNKEHSKNNVCVLKRSLKIIYATEKEKLNHKAYLDVIEKLNGSCLWKK